MKKIYFPILFFLFLCLAPGQLSALLKVEVAGGYSQQSPRGNFAYKGISLDMQTDLGYDKINTFTGRLRIETPPTVPNFYFDAMPMKFDGQGAKGLPFQFADTSFQANVPLNSSLQLDHYDVTAFYPVPFLDTATKGILNIDLGLNARILNFKAQVSQPTLGLAESKSLLVGVPMVYLALRLNPIKPLKIETEFKGVSYGSNRYADIAFRIKYKIFKVFFLSGGYDYQNIKIDQSDVHSNLDFGGPVFEAGLEF